MTFFSLSGASASRASAAAMLEALCSHAHTHPDRASECVITGEADVHGRANKGICNNNYTSHSPSAAVTQSDDSSLFAAICKSITIPPSHARTRKIASLGNFFFPPKAFFNGRESKKKENRRVSICFRSTVGHFLSVCETPGICITPAAVLCA